MNETGKVSIEKLATGVSDLDPVLGGGIPAYSFNIIAGSPGTGKTTLAHQLAFGAASPECPALYFTLLGESPLKMLRYQQQYNFFDIRKIDNEIRFINLSQEMLERNLDAVLERIGQEVEDAHPGIVIVDSFRTAGRIAANAPVGMDIHEFLLRLAVNLTNWQATTFLVGEYAEREMRDNPEFTVADGLIWLFQSVERNSIVRKLQVMKLRGQVPIPGMHTFRITQDGLQVFPRTFGLGEKKQRELPNKRIGTGIATLDEMMGSGIPVGDSVMVAGPSGSGKSILGTQFITEGIRQGEPGVIAVFEERPQEYMDRSKQLGMSLDMSEEQEILKVIYLRPLDLSVDETLREILDAIKKIDAKRVVIDSMNGFEMALAPAFRQDFRESLYRMVGALTSAGVTIITTVETPTSFSDMRFSPYAISFLTDDIILMRYVEIESQIRKIMTIVKMRGGNHSKDVREYEITPEGLAIGGTLPGYWGLITGIPHRMPPKESIGQYDE